MQTKEKNNMGNSSTTSKVNVKVEEKKTKWSPFPDPTTRKIPLQSLTTIQEINFDDILELDKYEFFRLCMDIPNRFDRNNSTNVISYVFSCH